MHLFSFNLWDTIGSIYSFYFVLYLVEFHIQWLWIDIVYVVSNSNFQNYIHNRNVKKKLSVTNIMKIARKYHFSTSKCPGQINVLYV